MDELRAMLALVEARRYVFNAVTDADRAEQDEWLLFTRDANTFVQFYDFISQMRNLGDTDLRRRQFFLRRILP